MKKLLIILICLFVSYEVRSREQVLKCKLDGFPSNLYYLDKKKKYFGSIPYKKTEDIFRDQLVKNFKETESLIETHLINIIDGLRFVNFYKLNLLDGTFRTRLINVDKNGNVLQEKNVSGSCEKYDGKQKF